MGEVLMHPIDGVEAGSNVKSINGKTGAVNLSKADVGLGNVDNTSDVDKPISTAVQEALDGKANNAVSEIINDHINNKNNPHEVTKAQVGLGSVANLDQSKAIKSITRSGTTFTATALDGTTTTFTQQDSNTTYGIATSSADGLMSAVDKSKLDDIDPSAITTNAANIKKNADEIAKLNSATGDSIDEATMNFTSSDVADGSATAWTSVPALASGEKHNAILGKVSQMFKNVRYLFKMLGTTDISGIGDGTATGAISALNADLAQQKDIVNSNASAIANNVPAESAWAMAAITGTTVIMLYSHNVKSIAFSSGHFRVRFSQPFQGEYYASVGCTENVSIFDYALDGFSIRPDWDASIAHRISVIALR